MKIELRSETQRESRREHVGRLLAWCEERLRTHPEAVESLLKISEALWDMGQRLQALDYSRRILTDHIPPWDRKKLCSRLAPLSRTI